MKNQWLLDRFNSGKLGDPRLKTRWICETKFDCKEISILNFINVHVATIICKYFLYIVQCVVLTIESTRWNNNDINY